MSRSFIGFGQKPYIGTPQAQPIKLGGIAGQAIPLLFQWVSYGAFSNQNINVLVDVTQQPCVKLDQIRSVYIDNLGSDNPIYVNFPDTNYTVVAKPNSEGWYPAYTNARQCWVVGEGFLSTDIPQTYIILSNIILPPAVNVEIDQALNLNLASPTITRGTTIYNSKYGVPSLGDQFSYTGQCSLNTATIIPLWGTPYASGFVYLNSLALLCVDPFNAGGAAIANFLIESTGIAGTLLSFSVIGTTVNPPGVIPIFQQSGMNVKLDATQTWRLRSFGPFISSGGVYAISSFTQQ
jgi:hypothetical protein